MPDYPDYIKRGLLAGLYATLIMSVLIMHLIYGGVLGYFNRTLLTKYPAL